jgi:hypothetical protein
MGRRFIKNRLQIGQRDISGEWKKLKEYGICSYVVLLFGISISAILIWACFYGVWDILTKVNNILSATESVGLSLLAAALGGILLLLVKPRSYAENERPEQNVSRTRTQTAGLLGYSLIAAAMAFALFALLTPFLNVISNKQRFFPHTWFGDFSEFITKWVTFISFMIGTVTLVMPLTFGPFLFLADFLSKRQEMRKLRKR